MPKAKVHGEPSKDEEACVGRREGPDSLTWKLFETCVSSRRVKEDSGLVRFIFWEEG